MHARIVARRIDADAGIARSEQQPVEDRGGDALGIVERMVRLQPRAHAARAGRWCCGSGSSPRISSPPGSGPGCASASTTAATISGVIPREIF